MPIIKLENSDFNNICALLECMTLSDIAHKYDCANNAIDRFLVKRGTTRKEVVNNHRIKMINYANETGEPAYITAKKMMLSEKQFNIVKNKLVTKRVDYWALNGY